MPPLIIHNPQETDDDTSDCSLKDNEGHSSNGTETLNRSEANNADDEINMIREELTRDETRLVFRQRMIVLLVLVATGIAMSYTIHRIIHQANLDAFQSEFEGNAATIVATLDGTHYVEQCCCLLCLPLCRLLYCSPHGCTNHIWSDHFLALDIVARTASTAGLAVTVAEEAQNWPYATLTAFEKRASNIRFLSGAIFVSINPIVKTVDLDSWESYVQSNASSWM